MKISIITICLNSRDLLERTIQSILRQSYTNIEYIIIDGGSQDGTLDILNKYDKDIDYWVSEPDKGISDAFNKGIKASSGDIIGFLNSQDYYFHDDIIAHVAELFSDHPETDIIYGRTCYTPLDSNVIVGVMGEPFSAKRMQRRNIMPHQSVFMRRVVIEQYGLYKLDYRYAMDYEHLLRATEHKVPLFANEIWAVMSLGGISDTNKFAVTRDLFRAQIEFGVPYLRALSNLLYHYAIVSGLKVLRAFNIYTLDHLIKKGGMGNPKQEA